MSVVFPHLLAKEVVGEGGRVQKIKTFIPCMRVVHLRNTGDKNYHLSSIFNQKYHYSFVILKKYTSIHCTKMFKELSRVRFFFLTSPQEKHC